MALSYEIQWDRFAVLITITSVSIINNYGMQMGVERPGLILFIWSDWF